MHQKRPPAKPQYIFSHVTYTHVMDLCFYFITSILLLVLTFKIHQTSKYVLLALANKVAGVCLCVSVSLCVHHVQSHYNPAFLHSYLP